MDRWSVKPALKSLLAVGVLVSALWFESALLLVLAAAMMLVFAITSAVGVVLAFVGKRPRRAASLFVGPCALTLGLCAVPLASQVFVKLQFYLLRPGFEEMVTAQRVRMAEPRPVRMVVHFRDDSSSALTTCLEFFAYDETDAIEKDPDKTEDWWLFPSSPNGKIDLSQGTKSILALGGHYYRIREVR